MRAEWIRARGFRNLDDLDLVLPPDGAVFLGPNGHGKTNLLELLCYPVLFRSLRGARDAECVRHGEAGFHLALGVDGSGGAREVEAGYLVHGRRKRIAVDGAEPARLSEALGGWLAVAFLPTDLRLVQGGAAERRGFLDRVLALADRSYLRALARYRRALGQRNAALRQRRRDLAVAFDAELARHGSVVTAARLDWCARHAEPFTAGGIALGESAEVTWRYRGDAGLADPGGWAEPLARAAARDEALAQTTIGPHRHDLELRIGSRLLREVGSTGQQRTAAIALRLRERATLAEASGTEPALLLDDVFAELDRERQARLAAALLGGEARQVFVTSPRADELPAAFHLEVLAVERGRVRSPAGGRIG